MGRKAGIVRFRMSRQDARRLAAWVHLVWGMTKDSFVANPADAAALLSLAHTLRLAARHERKYIALPRDDAELLHAMPSRMTLAAAQKVGALLACARLSQALKAALRGRGRPRLTTGQLPVWIESGIEERFRRRLKKRLRAEAAWAKWWAEVEKREESFCTTTLPPP